jgi:uncharacterized protein
MSRPQLLTIALAVLVVGGGVAYFTLEHIRTEAQAVDDGVVEFKKGNYEAAVRMLSPYAQRGDQRATLNVGIAYALGLGVSRDRERAHSLLRRAMGPKALEMYVWVAKSFEKGDGVGKDAQEAIAWYQIAANEGSVEARAYLRHDAAPST